MVLKTKVILSRTMSCKSKRMISSAISTIFIFLILFTARSNSLTTNGEQDVEKIWLIGNSSNSNPKYIYELNNESTAIANDSTMPLDEPKSLRSKGSILNSTLCNLNCTIENNDGNSNEGYETSASVLKPSHRGGSLQDKRADSNLDHKKSQAPQRKRNDINNSGSKNANKRNKIKYIKNSTRKISLAALLPKSKRQDLPSNKILSNDFQLPDLRSFELIRPGPVPSQPMITYPANHRLMFNQLFSQIPLPTSAHHSYFNFARPQDLSQHSALIEPFQQAAVSSNLHHPFHSTNQLLDHYQQHIDLPKQAQPPQIFYTGIPNESHQQQSLSKGDEIKLVQDENKLAGNTISAEAVTNQAQQPMLTGGSAISATASLGERAKSLLSQLSLTASSLADNKNNLENSIRTSRDTTANNILKADSTGLASMIKNAAEVWAANNAGTGTTPTIIVEHDGPTITSVDFGNGNNNLPRQQAPPVVENDPAPAPPEDEEVSAFYSEESEETEGSNAAKQYAKLKHHQHPFSQQVSSHPIQTEIPFSDDFFDNNEASHEFAQKRLRHNIPPHIVNDALHEYIRYQKVPEPPYPDSINAIKEQNSNKNGGSNDSLGNKLSGSNNDQIEKLIKELQDLKKRKQANESDEENNKSSKGDPASLDSDYENPNGEDDEDEQTRLLRKKVLQRLRGKRSRKRGHDRDTSASNQYDPAIKIPLHALLLAALDRRMSSSEHNQRTLLPDLIGDPRNKNIVASAQKDFSDVTSNLGSLMNSNNIFETLLKVRPLYGENGTNFSASQEQRELTNSSQVKEQDFQPPAMFILNNFGLPDLVKTKELMNQRVNGSVFANEINRARNILAGTNQHDEQAPSATTRMPTITQTTRKPSVKDHQKNYSTRARDSTKERRDVSDDSNRNNDGDFDLDKQVEEFSRDKNEASLEPVWARTKSHNKGRGKGKNRKRNDPSVEFDDDVEDIAETNRRKVLKRRRLPPKLDDSAFQRNADRFFKNVHKDTSESNNLEVDKNTSGIEDPIEPMVEEMQQKRRPSPSNRDEAEEPAPVEDDKEVQPDRDAQGGDDSANTAQNDDNENYERHNNNKQSSESRSRQSTWRPQMIDDEVRKLEQIAENKKRQRERARSEEQTNEQPDNENQEGRYNEEEPAQRYEETSESRNQATTVQPESYNRLTIDSNDSGTDVNLHFFDHPRSLK